MEKKYVVEGVEMSEKAFQQSGWTIVDFEPAPDLGKHGWSITLFNNDENRYATGYQWQENESGVYV